MSSGGTVFISPLQSSREQMLKLGALTWLKSLMSKSKSSGPGPALWLGARPHMGTGSPQRAAQATSPSDARLPAN